MPTTRLLRSAGFAGLLGSVLVAPVADAQRSDPVDLHPCCSDRVRVSVREPYRTVMSLRYSPGRFQARLVKATATREDDHERRPAVLEPSPRDTRLAARAQEGYTLPFRRRHFN
jgi:hypothetical protein